MTSHPIDFSAVPSSDATGHVSPVLYWPTRLIAAIVRRHRNAAAAAWLEELPPYLLADIGIDRSGIEDIRVHGRPRPARSACGRRRLPDVPERNAPPHPVTGVDNPASRP